MSTEIQKPQFKLPTLAELIKPNEEDLADNQLMIILNQPPPAAWLLEHPTAKIKNELGVDVPLPYLPINKVEYLLVKIYGKYKVEVRNVMNIANSVLVTVRLYVTNPITQEEEWHDGVGACPIQTNKGAGAMDWNAAKANGVQIAAPAAETYAIKDAAEKFGKIFGKDLGRRDTMDYNALLKTDEPITEESLQKLYNEKKDLLTPAEQLQVSRIIDKKETLSYKKIHTLLKSK